MGLKKLNGNQIILIGIKYNFNYFKTTATENQINLNGIKVFLNIIQIPPATNRNALIVIKNIYIRNQSDLIGN